MDDNLEWEADFPTMISHIVLTQKISPSLAVAGTSGFFEEIRSGRLSLPYFSHPVLPPPEDIVFYRLSWRRMENLQVGRVIQRLRDSKGKYVVAFASLLDDVDQMLRFSKSIMDYGALGCILFTPRIMFTVGDLEAIRDSDITLVFTTDMIHGGEEALAICTRIVPIK